MALRTQELFEAIMVGHEVTPDELDALLRDHQDEDLFLEYKHGNELIDRKKGSETVRQYASGFANADGGVLMVGIDEDTWSVTGATAPGGHDLARWASDCLEDMKHYFLPPPRFQVVHHRDGNVLIVAVARSLNLVPCVEDRRVVYYLRIHDKTPQAPEYLISDLILGRRAHPYLHITNVFTSDAQKDFEQRGEKYNLHFTPTFEIENQNFSWAEDIIVGIIGYNNQDIPLRDSISRSLLAHVDVRKVDRTDYIWNASLGHYNVDIRQMRAFVVQQLSMRARYIIPLHINNAWFRYVWRAAAYIVSKGSPPIWYQVNLDLTGDLAGFINGARSVITLDDGFLTYERLVGTRPIVAWEGLRRA